MMRRSVLFGVAVATLVAACNSGGADGDRSADKDNRKEADGSATAPKGEGIEAQVLEDYRAYWRALFGAGDPPNSSDPALAAHATGQALADAEEVLNSAATGGTVRRGSQVMDPAVTSVESTSAAVRDCYRDNWLLYALEDNFAGVPAGTRLEEPSGPKLRVVTMMLDGDTWKVAVVGPPLTEQRPCGSLAEEQAVVDAYERYHRTLYKVFSEDRPDPEDPRLVKVLARENDALRHERDVIREDRENGVIRSWSSPKALEAERVEIISYTDRVATVRACGVDDGTLTDAQSGEVISPPSTTPMITEFDLVVENGTWKVSGAEEQGPCELP